jgi:hypothetical protein
MGKIGVAIVCVLLAACSSAESGSTAEALTTCSKADRQGTWMVTMTRLSGDCPKLDPFISNTASAVESASVCKTQSELWSEGDCAYELVTVCSTENFETRSTSTTRQVSKNQLRGKATISHREAAGSCVSTYDVTYDRQ